MQRRIVVHNGKKFCVNVAGWEDGVGSGAPPGQIWMKSTDGNWYSVALTGTGASVTYSINQTPLGWIDPGGQAFAYQLLKNPTNGNVYKVTLSGSAGSVEMFVSSTPWTNPADFKPYFSLQSPIDAKYYVAGISGSTPAFYVDPSSSIDSKINR